MERKILEKVAEVARLKLSEEEINEFNKDIETILEHFSKIKEIECKEEFCYVHKKKNECRKDMVVKGDEGEDMIKLFNKKNKRFLSAPKSLE